MEKIREISSNKEEKSNLIVTNKQQDREIKTLVKSRFRTRIRRRSKNIKEGRNFKCHLCHKAYLSCPALYTHIRTKHQLLDTTKNKVNETNGLSESEINYDSASFEYFLHPNRKGITANIEECFHQIFQEVYANLQRSDEDVPSKIYSYKSIDEHNLFKIVMNGGGMHTKPVPDSSCDEIFAYYLLNVAKCTNCECFKNVLKFIVLYREYFNTSNYEKTKNKNGIWTGVHYSQVYNADEVPDVSNEFVAEYFSSEFGYFGMYRKDTIEYINNLCNWMYENDYTCSKVTKIVSN